ncbi:hypothetical protein niasHT_022246 [Heterodera trifolii]|uniref:B30.2/SPRY domain-containing protein n=1 Tax=Heterodera trifolii TaxID=157864 RepID=A0ABD2KL57_9BILA
MILLCSIGLATKAMPLDGRVGQNSYICAYQSDGHFWANGSKNFGMPNFSHGDFVGCGINLATQRIIFTKNGQPLDTSDLFLSPPFDFALFPFVSLNNSGDLIETNFGPQFKFDPAKYVLAKYSIVLNKHLSDLFYYEISVLNKQDRLLFGVITKAIYAYESDGEFWINEDRKGANAKYSYGVGDTVGIGVHLITRQLFFTRNGQRLDRHLFSLQWQKKLSKSVGWRRRAEFKQALAETIELQDQSVVRVSCHELGHGGTAWFDEDNIDEVGKVCNRPTPDADGYTEYNLAGRYTRKQLKAKLTALLGGKVGETLFTGTIIGHLGDDVHNMTVWLKRQFFE